ncbi:ABC transporter permease [Virgibacillus kekensis]|uniref:ABC transporter permease n=1 Tax=Virgibacillus kekensis TaxID=202261 RepID=A0ABV9DGI6_9BACI
MKNSLKHKLEISSLIGPATILVTLLFIFPLINFLRTSFSRNIPSGSYDPAWTFENFVEFFSDPYFLGILWNTIYISIIATFLTLILAFPIAYLLARANVKYKGILVGLVVFPLLVGNIVRDVGWIALFSEQGLVNNFLLAIGFINEPATFLGTPGAVIIAISNVVLPYMIISIQSVIERINPSLEEGAIDLGASRWMMMRTVIFPLAMPGIMAGTLFVFILSMNAYTTPLIIGGTKVQMMAPALYSEITEVSNWPMGAAMAVILIVLTLIASVFYLSILEKTTSGNLNSSTEVKG